MKPREPINLLELKPLRNLRWEDLENGKVVLLVPKFRNRYVVRWFVPMLAKPNIRVKLDEFGSYVWHKCDGNTTVGEISDDMSNRFSEPVDSLYDRIGKFIQRLAKDKFVMLERNGTSL